MNPILSIHDSFISIIYHHKLELQLNVVHMQTTFFRYVKLHDTCHTYFKLHAILIYKLHDPCLLQFPISCLFCNFKLHVVLIHYTCLFIFKYKLHINYKLYQCYDHTITRNTIQSLQMVHVCTLQYIYSQFTFCVHRKT